jgi:hypothetical protein
LRLNIGCPSEDREDEPGDNPWVRDSRHPNKSVRADYAFCERGSRVFTRYSVIGKMKSSTHLGVCPRMIPNT